MPDQPANRVNRPHFLRSPQLILAAKGDLERGERQPLVEEGQRYQLELNQLRQELQLARSERDCLSHFYESTTAPIVVLDESGVLLRANAAGHRLVDLGAEQLQGHRFEPLIIARDRLAFRSFLSQVFAGQSVDQIEITLIGQYPARHSIRATLATDGQFCHLIVTEVNRPRETEARSDSSLRDSVRQRLEAAMDLANMVDWDFDLTTLYFTFNDRFYAMCGTTVEREGGYLMSAERFLHDFCHPDDRHLIQAEITKALVDPDIGSVLNVEYRLVRRDNGEIRYGYAAYHIIADADGKATRGFGIHQDITELMHTQALLLESEVRFRVAIESLQEGFVLQTHDGSIISCNQSALRILGLTYEQLTGMTSLDPRWRAIHEDGSDFPGEGHPAMVSLRDGVSLTGVVMGVHRPSGELVWISINSVPLGLPETPTAVVVTFTDITHRKLTDAELVSSRRRLELLSRQLITTRENEMQNLSRELHDEFGQVLTAMKMNLRSIQSTSDGKLISRLDENIGMIDLAISQVRNLAVYLRPPQLNELGLAAALHGYLSRQAALAGFKHQLIIEPAEIDVPQDLAIVCFRIAQEAITNAIRHSAMQEIEIQLRQEGNQLQLEIRDDGAGFDVNQVLARMTVGSGLGLIGMQERASLVGGHLKILSALGRGTTILGQFSLRRHDIITFPN